MLERFVKFQKDTEVEIQEADFKNLRTQISDLLTLRGEAAGAKFFDKLLLPVVKLEPSKSASNFIKFESTLEYEGKEIPIYIATDVRGHYSDYPQLANFLVRIGDKEVAIDYRIDKYRAQSRKFLLKDGQLYRHAETMHPVDVVELSDQLRQISQR